jgi:hypothetical protein
MTPTNYWTIFCQIGQLVGGFLAEGLDKWRKNGSEMTQIARLIWNLEKPDPEGMNRKCAINRTWKA